MAVTLAAVALAATQATKSSGSKAPENVVISEFMALNQGAVPVEGPAGTAAVTPDWLELHNPGQQDVDLQGWKLTDKTNGTTPWELPKGASIPAGGYLVIYATGRSDANASMLEAPFRLSGDGEALALLRPEGSIASAVGPLVSQRANVSFGLPGDEGDEGSTVVRDGSAAAAMTFLSTPTPGAPNAPPLPVGPFILNATRNVLPAPSAGAEGVALQVNVAANLNAVSSVAALVMTGLAAQGGQEVELEAQVEGGQHDAGSALTYTVVLPASVLSAPGTLLRWRFRATDAAGYVSWLPAGQPEEQCVAGGAAANPTYWGGTVVELSEEQRITDTLPVLEWFSPNSEAATSREGSTGQVLFYAGRLYDGVEARRRGVTSLGWPKPKLKFELPGSGPRFHYADDMPPVEEFGLQSFWFELGERSYMKETLALQLLREAGVPAPNSFHVHLRLNGEFYGLFAFVEMVDDTFLKRHGLPPASPEGPLIKSVSGELSNLRWDLPLNEMASYWEYEGPGIAAAQDTAWQLLANLSTALAGGGTEPRSKTVFDSVNLPVVLNNMAAQALVLNMDRCTKNFFMYLNSDTQEWYMLPWDLDGSFGQDNGLGGRPGDNYCVLACEQWNSPLYCDSEHPQDLSRTTQWGTVTVPLHGSYQGPAITTAGSARKLAQQQSATPAAPPPPRGSEARAARRAATGRADAAEATGAVSPMYAAGEPVTKFPEPRGWSDPDRVTVKESSPIAAPGTYNHLVDALLDTEATRAMYLRRLRTLADTFLGGGRLAAMAEQMYNAIKLLAERDAAKWNSGIDVTRGYTQITREFLPIRTKQLLGARPDPVALYGPQGVHPLLPGTQPDKVELRVARFSASPAPAWVEVANPGMDAVDVSGWQLQGAANFTFAPGTVIPGSASAFVTTDLLAFRGRADPPLGGMGLLVVGPLTVPQQQRTASGKVQLLDPQGAAVGRGQRPSSVPGVIYETRPLGRFVIAG